MLSIFSASVGAIASSAKSPACLRAPCQGANCFRGHEQPCLAPDPPCPPPRQAGPLQRAGCCTHPCTANPWADLGLPRPCKVRCRQQTATATPGAAGRSSPKFFPPFTAFHRWNDELVALLRPFGAEILWGAGGSFFPPPRGLGSSTCPPGWAKFVLISKLFPGLLRAIATRTCSPPSPAISGELAILPNIPRKARHFLLGPAAAWLGP